MIIGAEFVTDVTDVTNLPYPPYTRVRARHNLTENSVTSVTPVTLGFGGQSS